MKTKKIKIPAGWQAVKHGDVLRGDMYWSVDSWRKASWIIGNPVGWFIKVIRREGPKP